MRKFEIFSFFILLTLCLVRGDDEQPKKKKPFGLGIGPVYIGGSDIRAAHNDIVEKIYKQYRNYRVAAGIQEAKDEEYHVKWSDRQMCDQGCNSYSECFGGLCGCKNGSIQVFGQCYDAQYVAFASSRSDENKFRKPPDPPKPETCFEYVYERDEKGNRKRKKIIKESMLNVKACQTPPFIRKFDLNEQNCTFWKPCNEKGVNLICDESIDRCACRQGTQWNVRTMECQVFLDVDCQHIKTDPDKDLLEMLKQRKMDPSKLKKNYTRQEIDTAFCYLLDIEAEEYLKYQVDDSDFAVLGLSVGAFIGVTILSICGACCFCKCCASCKQKIDDTIKSLDPRQRLRDMDQNTQMAALGAIAAGEMLEKRNEQNDEFKAAQMQGTVPAAPTGYTPVPNPGNTGYPPAQAVYPPAQGAVYPPAQGGPYPPAQGGAYPPAQGQPGYVPQPVEGVMSYIPNAAPEAIMGAVGAYTGNQDMMTMGVVGAIDKVRMDNEHDEHMRTQAMKGAPPPPMGYAGGAPIPAPATRPNPLENASYPRQT